jgi:hypothetical protein
MRTPAEDDQAMGRLRRFFSHPIAMIIMFCGTLARIIAIPLAFYFAGEARKTRELTYYVHPVKASVVKAGEASQLSVSYAGKELTTDVTAAQIQIWNQGREAIHKAEILRPLVISTEDHTPILEAAIRKQTRPNIVHLTLDDSAPEQGRLGVSWDILEGGDGGIV